MAKGKGWSHLEGEYVQEVSSICNSEDPFGEMKEARLTKWQMIAVSEYLDRSNNERVSDKASELGLSVSAFVHCVQRGLERFRANSSREREGQ